MTTACPRAFLLLAVLVASTPARGQAPPGDLQSLIAAAIPGTTVHVGPGVYRAGVRIGKPLALIGDGWPVIDGRGEGTGIVIEAPDVTVQGFVIRDTGISLDTENAAIEVNAPRARVIGNRIDGALFGILLRRAAESVIAGNDIQGRALPVARRGDAIRLWYSPGTRVERNRVVGGRDCVFWFSSHLTVTSNEVRDGRYGLHFMYSDQSVVADNRLEDNSVGAFLMYSDGVIVRDNLLRGNRGPSGYGLGLKTMDGVTMEGNRIIGNRVGVHFDESPSSLGAEQLVRRNLIACNDVGLVLLPAVRGNVFVGNAFVDNGQAVGVTGGGRFDGNTWTRDGRGNYWSDYAGYDARHDGVGDVPHRLDNLFGGLMDKQPALALFAATPAAWLLDQSGRAFPIIRREARVVDTAPLLTIPAIPSATEAPAAPTQWPAIAVSLGMCALAGLVVARGVGRRPTGWEARP